MATPKQRSVSAERVIAAPAEEIFAVLANPSRHIEIAGTGTLRQLITSNAPLTLGSTFSMRVKIIIPYKVKNRVLEFEEDRLIGWAHTHGALWRYELEPQPDGSTLVCETFDYSRVKLPVAIELMGFHRSNVTNMEKTLERLAAVVETAVDETATDETATDETATDESSEES